MDRGGRMDEHVADDDWLSFAVPCQPIGMRARVDLQVVSVGVDGRAATTELQDGIKTLHRQQI